MLNRITDPRISTLEEAERQLGHKLNDIFTDDNGYEVQLKLYNGIIAYVFTKLEITEDELAEYTLNSSKVSSIAEIFSNISKNLPEDFIRSCIKIGNEVATEGRMGLRNFIKIMNKKYNLPEDTDYSGEKFYIPLFRPFAPMTGNNDACKDCNQ